MTHLHSRALSISLPLSLLSLALPLPLSLSLLYLGFVPFCPSPGSHAMRPRAGSLLVGGLLLAHALLAATATAAGPRDDTHRADRSRLLDQIPGHLLALAAAAARSVDDVAPALQNATSAAFTNAQRIIARYSNVLIAVAIRTFSR
jgi:hypothetical protein